MLEAQIITPTNSLTFEAVWTMFQETDKKFQELAASQKETDKRLKELAEEVAESRKETDIYLKRLGRQIGGVHHSFGRMAEHMVAPSIAARFNELGFHFDKVAKDGVTLKDDNGRLLTEIDLLLENGESMVAVEVKAEPKTSDITHHLKRLEILRIVTNEIGDKRKIQGAIAGAIYDKTVKEAVLEAGLYVVAQSGDTMRLEIPAGFKPREWGPQ
jgi:hypothetical protein